MYSSTATIVSPATTKRKPSTFLTLPAELRQEILLNSFGPGQAPYPHAPALRDYNEQVKKWAATLCQVHADIVDDVMYVKGTWRDTMQAAMMMLVEELDEMKKQKSRSKPWA